MPAVADLALGIAPIAGGMALGAAAGYLKGPDVRRAIKEDMELLKELPPTRWSDEPNFRPASTAESTI